MLLLVCATEMEQQGLPERLRHDPRHALLLTGVGPVEAAVTLTSHLGRMQKLPAAVLNFGVGGAYPAAGLGMLEICLAESEVLGDLGVETADGMQTLPEPLQPPHRFAADRQLLHTAADVLSQHGLQARRGPFVTVCCSSGTTRRGRMLAENYGAICENMEGAAIARVCAFFGVAFLELRCISNMVEDRDTSAWRLQEAARKAAEGAGLLAARLSESFAAVRTNSS